MALGRIFRLLLAVLSISAAGLSCRRSDMQTSEVQQIELQSVRSSWIDQISDSTSTARVDGVASKGSSDSTSNGRAVSRVTEVGFQQDDHIGVFVHRSPVITEAGLHSSNVAYAMTGSGQWRPNTPLTDPLSEREYWVTAYYPYNSDLKNITIVEHSVELNQSASAGALATALERSDFCLTTSAATLGELQSENPKAELIFTHMMSKIQLDIDVPQTIDKAQVAKLESVVLCNLYASCQINLEDQSLVLTRQGNNKILPRLVDGGGTPGSVSTYQAIVVPQQLTSGIVFAEMHFVMKDGSSEVLEYKIPDVQNFALLRGQKITLSLSATGQLAFLNELDLLDGLAKTDLVLEIKAPKGKVWSLSSSQSWLTLSLTPGTGYKSTLSGVGTGAKQTLYVKVSNNQRTNTAINNIRASILTLKSKVNTVDLSVEYTATQNYATFEPIVSDLPGNQTQHTEAGAVFSTNYYWHALSDKEWLKFSTSNTYGQGEPHVRYPAYSGAVIGELQAGKMWYQFAANPTASERRATVSFVSYYDGKQGEPYKTGTRTVIQRASSLTGNNPSNLPALVGSTKLTFSTTPHLPWSITGMPDWVSDYRPTAGVVDATGVVEVSITGVANGGSVPRKANLTVTAGEMTLPLVLTQSGGDFNLDPVVSNLVANASSTLGFKVESTLGGTWTVESVTDKGSGAAVTWMTVAPMAGLGQGAGVGLPMTLTAGANNTDAARVAVVTVKSGAETQTIEFTQRAAALSNFTQTLGVYGSTAPASWASGNFTVTPINDALSRSMDLLLQWKMASSDATNLTVSHTTAQTAAAANVRVSVLANNTNAARTLYYYLYYGALNGTLKSEFSIKQGPPAFSVGADKSPLGPHVTSDYFNLTTSTNHEGVKYSLAKSANITSLTPAVGNYTVSGTANVNQRVDIGFAQNTGALRTHTVTVGSGTSLTNTYTITQQAVALSLSPATAPIGADGGSVTTGVTSNTPYATAVTSSYGGSVSPVSGATPPYGSRITTLSGIPAQPTYPAAPRNHTVVFTPSPDYVGNSQVRTFTVTQAERPTSISFSSYSPGTIEANSATYTIVVTANTPWSITSESVVTVSPRSSTTKGPHNTTVTVTVPRYLNYWESPRTFEFTAMTTNDAGVENRSAQWYGYQKGSGTALNKLPSTNVYVQAAERGGFTQKWSTAVSDCSFPWRLPSYSELAQMGVYWKNSAYIGTSLIYNDEGRDAYWGQEANSSAAYLLRNRSVAGGVTTDSKSSGWNNYRCVREIN